MPEPSRLSIRFGPFLFSPHSGELRRCETVGQNGDGPEIIRLPPQPAKLLSHLIERRPHLVSHDDIRTLLWPNVEVEFEESVHTCVRKIRSALNDSASDPLYIETIPRRGYRFVGEAPEPEEDHTTLAPADSSRAHPRRARRPLVLVAGLALIAVVAFSSSLLRDGKAPPRELRIAVMPFEPKGENSALTVNNDIAESIVELLSNQFLPAAMVIGPTTTERFDGPTQRIKALVEELEVDYLVHGRELRSAEGQRLLVEIIRGCDGAHVWVQYLDEIPTNERVGPWIAKAVASTVKLPTDC